MRALLLVASVLLLLPGLGGCAGGPGQRRLTYAQVQALNPGVDVDWVLREYPGANQTRDAAGRVRRMEFAVVDPYGKGQSLFLEFDPSGTCTRKQYTGAVVRPAP